jgi:hypothetical protein
MEDGSVQRLKDSLSWNDVEGVAVTWSWCTVPNPVRDRVPLGVDAKSVGMLFVPYVGYKLFVVTNGEFGQLLMSRGRIRDLHQAACISYTRYATDISSGKNHLPLCEIQAAILVVSDVAQEPLLAVTRHGVHRVVYLHTTTRKTAITEEENEHTTTSLPLVQGGCSRLHVDRQGSAPPLRRCNTLVRSLYPTESIDMAPSLVVAIHREESSIPVLITDMQQRRRFEPCLHRTHDEESILTVRLQHSKPVRNDARLFPYKHCWI